MPEYIEYLEKRGLEMPSPDVCGTGWAHQLTLCGTMSGPVEASVPYFLAESTIDALQEKSKEDKPFFIALNFWGPHAPYYPSEPYASMYNKEDIPEWGNFNDDFTGKPGIYEQYRNAFIGEGSAKREWSECAEWAALYFGFATQIDHQIGRVLDELDKLGIADDTAVLFSCDHGDLCGAHGGMHDKGGVMVQEVYHIPFMGRLPGGKAGATCDHPISNLDIPATVLDLAGVEKDENIDGKSLVPVLEGKDIPEEWPDFIVTEFFGHHYSYETRMLVHNDFKYVFHPSDIDELYDLKNDPWEMTNLIKDDNHKEMRIQCRKRLLQWAKDNNDEVCILAGLYHERLDQPAEYNYAKGTWQAIRESKTTLIEEN
ncbi:MAG: sulfatase-like hydrolase/transferase [Planctomycetota bacterium]|jgi:arylsulfatase A-like enzyme